MSSTTIQNQISGVFASQEYSQFGTGRYALLFEPGTYTVNIPVGYYTQVLGAGITPDGPSGTTIDGFVNSIDNCEVGNADDNFWRGVENVAVNPSDTTCDTVSNCSGTPSENPCESADTIVWAVSQSCPLRRVHIEGNLQLDDWVNTGNQSGGVFIGDSLVDGWVDNGSQTEATSRNDQYQSWSQGLWNTVFVGTAAPPTLDNGSGFVYSTPTTPEVREKPFLTYGAGVWSVFAPSSRPLNSTGPSWTAGPVPGTSLPISDFYIAQPGPNIAESINAQLASGMSVILTPGIYELDEPINVTKAGTIVLGLGFATLQPTNGTAAMTVADVNGVDVSGILFDAGTSTSPVSPFLLQVGPRGSSTSHAANPITLHDDFFRVGGYIAGQAAESLEINSDNVIADDLWIWRADHGNAGTVGWTINQANNGLVVNGNDVTIYGLECEHFQQYQTIWNGNGGSVYMYESEIPYDVPSQSGWMSTWQDVPQNGYPSYKVADCVTSHQAFGLDIASWFSPEALQNAIEVPRNQSGVQFTDMWIASIAGPIDSIIDGLSGLAGPWYSTLAYYPPSTPAAIGTPTRWGFGDDGGASNELPVQVPDLTGVTTVAGGEDHSLALQPDGDIWAWGANSTGQLGDNSTAGSVVPAQVSQSTGLVDPVGIAGGAYHSLALQSGNVWDWGLNDFGQIGLPPPSASGPPYRDVPVKVPGLANAVAVAGGGGHSLALDAYGNVWAWGFNEFGQLGDGTVTNSYIPVEVSGVANVVAIAGGGYHSLAVLSDGSVWAWGYNVNGELGNASTTNSDTPVQAEVPVVITGGVPTTVTAVAAGMHHSLALRSDGTVWAWGYNGDGELGSGGPANSSVPIEVPIPLTGGATVVAIACGAYHCLALRSDGTVWAWGNDALGQLGIDTLETSSAGPVQVDGILSGSYLTSISAIAGGGNHSLALASFNPPYVVDAADAVPSVLSGTTTNLSALGADSNWPETDLTYTWTMTGPKSVTYSGSTNGTNAAQNITVTFAAPGTYTFTVTITDPYGLTATSSVPVVVDQKITRISVTPPSVIMVPLDASFFTATVYDQFGNTMANLVSWKELPIPMGSLIPHENTAVYRAGIGPLGTYTIEAYIGSVSGHSTVKVD